MHTYIYMYVSFSCSTRSVGNRYKETIFFNKYTLYIKIIILFSFFIIINFDVPLLSTIPNYMKMKIKNNRIRIHINI